MMYAQVLDGTVKNVIDLEDSSLISLFQDGFDALISLDGLTPTPGINWSYDGSIFSPPVETPDTTIPDVTPRQMRQALILNGVSLSQIDAALASLPDPQKSLAQVEWEYSIAFQRNRPLVVQVGQMLGWSSAQLDSLWKFAATL